MPEPLSKPLDLKERLRALTEKDSTFLVEAGAGSGKTSIMAGRIALLIAGGEEPGAIVAVTFTEVAAAELRHRIEGFLREIASGITPRDLAVAFPAGVPKEIIDGAQAGLNQFDDMVATTIHGFAQAILRPYPLEAGMDPGAAIADPEVANMAFDESVEGWMRDVLNGDQETFLTTFFAVAPTGAAASVRTVARAMRRTRGTLAPAASWDPSNLAAVQRTVQSWITQYPISAAIPDSLKSRTAGFVKLIASLSEAPTDSVATILGCALPRELTTQKGEFNAKAATKKDWETIGKPAGWGKVEIETKVSAMSLAWDNVRTAWGALKVHAASVAARRLTEEVSDALQRYSDWKRAASLLDFDDLLVKARNLLATNEPIRKALGKQYRRLLIDEFQDTDPLQMEIAWRLCGDPSSDPDDWRSCVLRPGALFLVGDPKQAIYRFRGADVAAYLEAKAAIEGSAVGEILSISVNFRSTKQILARVNQVYRPMLESDGQPGFAELSAYRSADGPEVQLLDVQIPDDILDEKGNPNAEGVRQVEAACIANFLTHIIGSLDIPDEKGGNRKVELGDVALLVPAGTAFWIYEAELEKAGIPVAPQAGKGFLNRQEVLDLTALARLMSDPRDSLALGAFLRGPVLGFTDEELLDALHALPGQGRRKLSLGSDVAKLPSGRFKEALENLAALRRIARTTTPFQALSAAVEAFSIKAVLAARHPRSVERSLANLDAFLSLAKAWDARGLQAFTDEIRRRREDGTRQVEGRPDSGADAVSIVTMHSSKGLEWPIVIPINMATLIVEKSGPIVTPEGLLLSLLDHELPGYEEANVAEGHERAHERTRILYVADTRARDLLILPRHSSEGSRHSWSKVCKDRLTDLTAFDHSLFEPHLPSRTKPPECPQDHAAFTGDCASIAAAHRVISRRTPSLHEAGDPPRISVEFLASDGETFGEPPVRGSAARGLVLHKIMEEILTGELEEGAVPLRAATLSGELGSGHSIEPDEIANTICRTLSLPEIVEIRAQLVAEVDVARLLERGGQQELIVGIADAILITANGSIEMVVDWKSDVAPDATTLSGYQGQMLDYLAATGASRGLIVLMSSGRVLEVQAAA
jgi:ATP-dependent exoDNAse (exonuclease V) beta subunit